ncbi:MAG: DNA methyltransferase [Blastocatellia bacterium]
MPDLNFDSHNTLYATHGLHAYAAKCPPPLVNYAIHYYSSPGETVLDPMAGSGTTLVEARLMGRHARGYDIDPLAC